MQKFFALFLTLVLFPVFIHSQHEIISKGNDIYLVPRDIPHTETFIFLHGVALSAQLMLDLYFTSKHTTWARSSTKVVLLAASPSPFSVWDNVVVNSWFDIYTFNNNSEEELLYAINLNDIETNSLRIKEVMREEINVLGGESTKLFIGGFSQGCILSLYCGLTFEQTLGGIIGLSGFLLPNIEENEQSSKTSIFLFHGKEDELFNFELVAKIYEERLDHNTHKIEKFYSNKGTHYVSLMAKLKTRDRFYRHTSSSEIIKPLIFISFILSFILCV